MDKALAKERLRSQKCPYCGADRKDLAHGNIENDGNEVFQVIDCIACKKHFTEVYSFYRVILTDDPGKDFRIDFNNIYAICRQVKRRV
jgi:transcriptional regulator NrdR family protein